MGRVSQAGFSFSWTVDPEGNLWTFLKNNRQALSQWNGKEWLIHKMPSQPGGYYELVSDTKGAIWLIPSDRHQPAILYHPRQAVWETFENLKAAYLAKLAEQPRFYGPRILRQEAPDYSVDGKRIVFRSRTGEINYFDGMTWRLWRPAEIASATVDRISSGIPFFDDTGRVCVTIDGSGFRWDREAEGWKRAVLEERCPLPKEEVDVPAGCVTGKPDSAAQDNQGAVWLTWQHRLYKALPGTCAPVFSNGENDPFSEGEKVKKAWVDCNGTAFVQNDSSVLVMITPKSPPPDTKLAVRKASDDSVELQMEAVPPGGGFVWSLDGQPFAFTAGKTVTLKMLGNGMHKVTAAAVNGDSQRDPSPAVAEFEIKVDPRKQMAVLIKLLSDPDFGKRKEVIQALGLQPAAALPALKAARPRADASVQWWIDAAIQQIERESKRGAKQGSAP